MLQFLCLYTDPDLISWSYQKITLLTKTIPCNNPGILTHILYVHYSRFSLQKCCPSPIHHPTPTPHDWCKQLSHLRTIGKEWSATVLKSAIDDPRAFLHHNLDIMLSIRSYQIAKTKIWGSDLGLICTSTTTLISCTESDPAHMITPRSSVKPP